MTTLPYMRDELTPREVEILVLASEGLSNSEIGARLWVTEQTVKFHMSNVFRKMGVKNRAQAAVRFQAMKVEKHERLCPHCGAWA